MRFGTLPLSEATGAILAHGIKVQDGMFKKGRVLTADDINTLRDSGVAHVIAAQLEADDVSEDEAARQVAVAACGSGAIAQQAFTGRANLHASVRGVVVIDRARVSALNHLHESLTLATLADFSVVDPKQMVATIKIIPFAVPRDVLAKALSIIGDKPLISVHGFQNRQAGLIITRLPQTKTTIIAKSETVIRDRLARLGAELVEVSVCDHAQSAVSEAIAAMRTRDPILVFGASAIVDRADVIPAAVVQAGGEVVHLGMPVDPGNLLMLGNIGAADIIGVPSCARSPKSNGFDWVLERLIAGLKVTASDIMAMGAGGLLAEIPSRPQPRESKNHRAPRVAAIVLAAGMSSRMGANKMLAEINGQPMLRATLQRITHSAVDDVVVVTGHEHGKVASTIAGTRARAIHNPHFAEGLSTSVRCGIEAVAEDADAVIVCLGDMPLIESQVIDRMIAAFNPDEHRNLVVPVRGGQVGNPVLWGREHYVKLMALEGDRGARALVEKLRGEAVEIEAESDAIFKDSDTPESLAEMQKK